jgi:hypothetical protein
MGEEDENNIDDGGGARRVRFHGRVQFKTIRHVKDFSDEEIREGWYRKRDFARMSEEVNQVAELVSSGQTSDGGEELCTRGLEHLIEEEIADYRAEKMIQSVDAVLDEQDDQRFENIFDQDTIAKLYGEIAAPLQREAYLVALRDAVDASASSSEEVDAQVRALMAASPPPRTAPAEKSSKKQTHASTSTQAAKGPPPPQPPSAAKVAPRDKAPKQPAKRPSAPPPPPSEDLKTALENSGESDATSDETCEAIPPPPEDDSPHLPVKISKPKASPSLAMKKKTLLMKKKQEQDSGIGTQALASPAQVIKKKVVAAAPSGGSPGEKPKRTRLDRKKGTEMSPLVRRRDGSFGFRNKDLELEKLELSASRKARVKNSLFRLIDGPEKESQAHGGLSIRDSMMKFIDECQVEEQAAPQSKS